MGNVPFQLKFKKKLLFGGFILFLFCIPLAALLHSGLPWTHDGQDHVARVANFYLDLQSGVLIPRWASNLNWGYGHPILEFLYPLPSYFGSFFHSLGFSFITSVKLVFAFSVVLSGVFMYLWLREFLDVWPAAVGGVLYLYAPYRFVELYVRGEFGELLAFMVVPLVLFFLIRLYYSTQGSRHTSFFPLIFFAFSLAGLILSHNSMALIFLPLILFYGFYLWLGAKKKKEFALLFLFGVILGFGLSAFFWIPGLLEGKYTLRSIVQGGGQYKTAFLTSFWPLVWGQWQYGGVGGAMFTVQLGVLQWIAFLGFPLLVWGFWNRRNQFIWLLFVFLYTVVSVFLMFPASDIIWSHIKLLQAFQFPWRFLAVPVFTAPVFLALLVSLLPKRWVVLTALICLVLMVFFDIGYIHPKGYINKPDIFFSGIYAGTTDTGESAPIWSVRFMEHQSRTHMRLIDGQATVKEIYRNPVKHIYSVHAFQRSQILENTLYFPGWGILVDGKPVPIEFQNPAYRGLMTFFIPIGVHRVEVLYGETMIRNISDVFSLLSLFIVGLFAFLSLKKL